MEGNHGDGTQECGSCGAHSHPRAAEFLLLCSARGCSPRSLSSSFSLSPSHGVAVQVTSITRTLNARRVPTSTSFCSPRNRCEIYLDSNIAAEIPTYCRALNYSVPEVSQRMRLNYASNCCLLPVQINK